MSLQQFWEKIDSSSGEELIQLLTSMSVLEKEFVEVKSRLRIAEWHLDWMQNSTNSLFFKHSIRRQREILNDQNNKILKYKILIEQLESNNI